MGPGACWEDEGQWTNAEQARFRAGISRGFSLHGQPSSGAATQRGRAVSVLGVLKDLTRQRLGHFQIEVSFSPIILKDLKS